MKIQNSMIIGCVLMALTCSSFAGVGFSRSRMVYPQGAQSISLKVSNSGDSPYLIQAKVSGDSQGKSAAPFIITPPLFRLEGKNDGMMRILMTAAALPSDRESVFYFSGRAIPASEQKGVAEGMVGASVSLSTRSIMKVFYRPATLSMTIPSSLEQVSFVRTAKGVVIKNPTPYYQSFAQLLFDGKPQDLDGQPSMVAPFSDLLMPSAVPVSQVTWEVMNDYGGTTESKTQAVQGGAGLPTQNAEVRGVSEDTAPTR